MGRRLTGLVLAAASVACGDRQSFPVDGIWMRGGVSGDHSGVIVLTLHQDGDRVVGLACHTDTGHLLYKDVPVAGPYPRVEFTEPSGCRFEGGLVSAELIDGRQTCPGDGGGPSFEWPFRRTTPTAYAECAATPR